MTAFTDLSECIGILATALGYPGGAPPPQPHLRITAAEQRTQAARNSASATHRRYRERVARYSQLRSRGWTIAQAAAGLEVTPRTIQRYEAALRREGAST